MEIVPFDEYTGINPRLRNTWGLVRLSNGAAQVVTRCENGHIGALVDHAIDADGTVSPSVVCQHAGCDYHHFIKLEGWTYGAKPAGVAFVWNNTKGG